MVLMVKMLVLAFCVVTPVDLQVDTTIFNKHTVPLLRVEMRVLEGENFTWGYKKVRLGYPASRNDKQMVCASRVSSLSLGPV
jgi:hypothetical protein